MPTPPSLTKWYLATAANRRAPHPMRRFDPPFWLANFARPMMAAPTTTDGDTIRLDCVFYTRGDLAGLIWESEDKADHVLLAYDTNRNYTGTVLQFRWRSSGIPPLNDVLGTVLTIEGRDAGVATTWYVRLVNYAVGSPTDAVITLDFDALYGGWAADGARVNPTDIDRLLIAVVPPGYESGNTTLLASPVDAWVDLSEVVVTGPTLTTYDPVEAHTLRAATGFDDNYSITPERLLRNIVGLGYRGTINHYVGMSHHFRLADSGGVLLVTSVGGVLNTPCVRWHQDFVTRAHALGYAVIMSMSYEVYDAHVPAAWKQRDWQGNPAATGWEPPSTLLSPTHADAMGYLHAVAVAFCQILAAAGLTVRFQIGEPWWWVHYGTFVPFFYDATATAGYLAETGQTAPVITTMEGAKSPTEQAFLDWLGVKLAASTQGITQAVLDTFRTAVTYLLFYAPQVMATNTPDLYRVNRPAGWHRPAFAVLQLEDYDFVVQGETANSAAAAAAVTTELGYPVSEQQYFSGFVLHPEDAAAQWPLIYDAALVGQARGVTDVFLWAIPQIIRDGFVMVGVGPPAAPVYLSPVNGDSNASSKVTVLSWQQAPSVVGPLVFDVYLGTTNPPPLVATNTSAPTYSPGPLIEARTYFWRIVTKHSAQAGSTAGALWHFTTAMPPAAQLRTSVHVNLNGVWTDVTRDVLLGSLGADYGFSGNAPTDALASSGTMRYALRNDARNSGQTAGWYSPYHANVRPGWKAGIEQYLWTTYAVPQDVTALTRAGGVVTVTTAQAHGYAVQQMVRVSGATPAAYTGVWRVATVVDPTTFTFAIPDTPATPATGPMTVEWGVVRFWGRINDIDPAPGPLGARRVDVVAYDRMKDLIDADLTNIALATNQTEAALLDFMFASLDPTQRPRHWWLDTGIDTIPIAFDNVGSGAKAGGVAADLLRSSYGLGFVFQDGLFRYLSRNSRATVLLGPVINSTMAALSAVVSIDRHYNVVHTTTHPRTQDAAPVVLWAASGSVPTIPAAGTIEMEGAFRDPADLYALIGAVSTVPLAVDTDWQANSAPNGTGTDLRANVTITPVVSASRVVFTISNSAGVPAYLVNAEGKAFLQIRGIGIYDNGPRSFTKASTQPYGVRSVTLDLPYQAIDANGQQIADLVHDQYAPQGPQHVERITLRATPLSNPAIFDAMFWSDIGSAITVTEPQTGVRDADMMILGVQLAWPNTRLLECTWLLGPVHRRQPPVAPTSPAWSPLSDTQVRVQWVTGTAGSHTQVYIDGGYVGTAGIGDTTFTLDALTPATDYSVTLRHMFYGMPSPFTSPITVRATMAASGGTTFDSGGYRYHVFTASGTLTLLRAGTVDLFGVGGGGGGGGSASNGPENANDHGGAGGGGGEPFDLFGRYETAGTFPVTIGAGGTHGVYSEPSGTRGGTGGTTTYRDLVWRGGGAGAGANTGAFGGTGASGGGGAGWNEQDPMNPQNGGASSAQADGRGYPGGRGGFNIGGATPSGAGGGYGGPGGAPRLLLGGNAAIPGFVSALDGATYARGGDGGRGQGQMTAPPANSGSGGGGGDRGFTGSSGMGSAWRGADGKFALRYKL
jgi:hypothetical protein